ncbi:MAG: hypothetical protein WKG00_08125 [Polyangiaceae bacterium]
MEPDPATCTDLTGAVDADTTLGGGGECYILKGIVKVSAKLTVEPGTWIFGNNAAPQGTLVVVPGGQLVADGTAELPITFTSQQAKGTRAPGDWGGVMLLGNDVCNDATGDALCEIEGLTDGTTFGNTAANAEPNDNSGTLRYVRISFAGKDIDGAGNEINSLTLGGVGSGTIISHVMVSNGLDDCFEWFGGSVNLDHIVANNCGDDMFDTDSGYSGHAQFVFGRQVAPITADPNGFEMDNDKTTFSKPPVSTPKFSNVTLCGSNNAAPINPEVGMVLRNGTDGALINSIITNFATAAISLRNVSDTEITLSSSIAFGNTAIYDSKNETPSWFENGADNSTEAPAGFGDCAANPPAPFPAAKIPGATPTGYPDAAANYIGAFEDAADNWMTGNWIDWSTN